MASAETTSSGTPSANARPALSGTPVAKEVPVIATGARASENPEKRELFKESTTTALVFPNGGVIRLSAAVAPGQLLFLNNPQAGQEVVAQVTRRRNNPAAGYYVELEFTEAAPDFWGVAFPAADNAAEVAVNGRQTAAVAEFLKPAEVSSDDLSPNAPAPTVGEVQALMEEVDALRAQLKSMQSQTAGDASRVAEATARSAGQVNPPNSAAVAMAAAEPTVSQSDAAPQMRQVTLERLRPSETRENSESVAPAAMRSDAPGQTDKHDTDEDLLPTPALDFQQGKERPAGRLAAAGDRAGVLRLALLAVVSLFAVMVAAWNMHWLPWASGTTGAPAAGIVPARAATAAAVARPSAPTIPQKDGTHPETNVTTTPGPTTSISGNDVAARTSIASERNAPDSRESAAAPEVRSTTKHEEDARALTPVAKHTPAHPADVAKVAPADDGETAVVPPKLVKSVRAVAPAAALRGFTTGNVTLDALVDKNGQVKTMKVLSGPASFHKAAMDALRQYRYEPARQNGKAVSAHVTVTVPFWFEP